jgi:nucleoside-diphosphate-sugar epimerase
MISREEAAMSKQLVLVTGGSGFVASYCIKQLLQQGYQVRTTVRSLAREADVRAMLAHAGVDAGEQLEFVAADLTSDTNWDKATAGCEYVLHVASPFSLSMPKNEDEMIVPARDGTLRVLRAAQAAGVKRLVLTSSFVAVAYGQAVTSAPFTEEHWTNIQGDVTTYMKSKTIAERAAWDFVNQPGNSLELSVVNPVGVFGPILGSDYSDTINLFRILLSGRMPVLPSMHITMVDVRDLADLQIRAMTNPAAKGQRFIAASDEGLSLSEIAKELKAKLGPAAARVPTRQLPDWILRLAAHYNATARNIARELGNVRIASNRKAREQLGWQPRSNSETIVATAQSLIQYGLV